VEDLSHRSLSRRRLLDTLTRPDGSSVRRVGRLDLVLQYLELQIFGHCNLDPSFNVIAGPVQKMHATPDGDGTKD
jgi:hypothetical protein